MDDRMTPASLSAGRQDSAQSGHMPMLSVLLLLLAFFILLVSMVEFDEHRTQAALGSLTATFNVPPDDAVDAGSGAAQGPEGVTWLLAVRIGKVLETLLRDDAFTIRTDGTVAVIRIDNDALFPVGLKPAPVLETTVARIMEIVAAAPRRYRYEFDVVQPFGEAGATRRAGIVVRAFEAAGIPSNRLMTSLLPGRAGETRIELYTVPASADGANRLSRVRAR